MQHLKMYPKDDIGPRKTIEIKYTSLYKIDTLTFRYNHSGAHIWRVHQQADGKINNVVTNAFVWGCELIHGIQSGCIEKVKLSEEITYFQSKIFGNFIN